MHKYPIVLLLLVVTPLTADTRGKGGEQGHDMTGRDSGSDTPSGVSSAEHQNQAIRIGGTTVLPS